MNPTELRKNFIEGLYSTLDDVVSPTPYLEITEDERVDVAFLDGRGNLPKPNTTEVTVLDLYIASLFFDDFDLLSVGVTGVGKTYTSDALFGAVFGSEGHYTIRLGGGLLSASALDPFTTTTLEHGIPKVHIDPQKCEQYGALFIDEINRGDTQEVFQVVDGTLHVNGDTGYLRVPIPGTERYKKLAVLAAMNPPDAQHSSALELDIAGENRFLKFMFPNGIDEAASSQLDKSVQENLYQKFWSDFTQRTGIKVSDWREIYPVITDSTVVRCELNGEAREFLDVAMGYVGKDPLTAAQRNSELLKSAGYEPKCSVVEDNALEQVRTAQKSLKHGFVRRDLPKVANLSRLLGFVKCVKDASYEPKATLHDVAAALGIVLESKKITGEDDGSLMSVVNDVLREYKGLRRTMNTPSGFGVRQAVWQASMYAGIDNGVDAYEATLRRSLSQLNTRDAQRGGVANPAVRLRLAADLAVLDHFSQGHKDAITSALAAGEPHAFEEFKNVYAQNKGPSVYTHRLSSVVR
jgi:hypothetical protein